MSKTDAVAKQLFALAAAERAKNHDAPSRTFYVLDQAHAMWVAGTHNHDDSLVVDYVDFYLQMQNHFRMSETDADSLSAYDDIESVVRDYFPSAGGADS